MCVHQFIDILISKRLYELCNILIIKKIFLGYIFSVYVHIYILFYVALKGTPLCSSIKA